MPLLKRPRRSADIDEAAALLTDDLTIELECAPQQAAAGVGRATRRRCKTMVAHPDISDHRRVELASIVLSAAVGPSSPSPPPPPPPPPPPARRNKKERHRDRRRSSSTPSPSLEGKLNEIIAYVKAAPAEMRRHQQMAHGVCRQGEDLIGILHTAGIPQIREMTYEAHARYVAACLKLQRPPCRSRELSHIQSVLGCAL